jgi:uncharacterized membrane protein
MQHREAGQVEARMRRISLAVSLLGLGFMIYGFTRSLVNLGHFSVPGDPVIPLHELIVRPPQALGMTFMSTGIVFLGVLPAIRVLLAIWVYFRSREARSMIIGLVVLLELLLSIRLSL